MKFGRSLLGHWELDPRWTFLNHGSFGATPRAVLAEQDIQRRKFESQPLQFMRDLPGRIRDIADLLGERIGAKGEDIALVTNASAGVQAVLSSLMLQPGDELLTTNHVYGAVRQALRHTAARSGASIIEAAVPLPLAGPEVVVSSVRDAISPRTRLAVFDHITSFSGLVFPIEAMIAECRARGVPVLVDGAHAPGLLPLNIEKLQADYYTGNLHKWWFAPKGSGILWVKKEHQPSIHPSVISHGYGQGFTQEFDWTGTFDPSAWMAIPAALAFADSLGLEAIRSYNQALCAEAHDLLVDQWGIESLAPPEMRSCLATFAYPTRATASDVTALAAALHAKHVEVPIFGWAGRCWLRISAQVYNQRSDYETLARAI